jgi:hypothetical protein
LAAGLAALGYPGFRHLRKGRLRNPAALLLAAIEADELEARVLEALPRVMVAFSDLNWSWLMGEAKSRDLQNRLGFLVTLARELAGKGSGAAVDRLTLAEEALNRARRVREDTLCHAALPEVERGWLRQNRPAAAAHWNLLTDLAAASLPYAA